MTNEIMLYIMQNFKFHFLENELRPIGVHVLSSISKALLNFSTGFFFFFSYRLYISENVCSFRNGTPNLWAPTKNVAV